MNVYAELPDLEPLSDGIELMTPATVPEKPVVHRGQSDNRNAPEARSPTAEQLFAAAQKSLHDGRLEDGIDLIHRALESTPNDPRLYNALGIAQSRRGQHGEARGLFERAVRLSPNTARYWYNLGTATQGAGQLLQAGRYYQVAIRIDPTYERSAQALRALQQSYPDLPLITLDRPVSRPAVEADPPDRTLQLNALDLPVPSIAARPAAVASLEGTADVDVLDHRALRYPGLGTRLTALLVDVTVIQVLWLGAIILMNLLHQQISGVTEFPNGFYLLAGFGVTALYVIGAAALRKPTLGKRALHLQLVGPDGQQPSPLRCVARAALSTLSLATIAGYVWMTLNPRRQSLHDRLSSTYVVGRILDPGAAAVWIAGLVVVNFYLFSILLGPQITG